MKQRYKHNIFDAELSPSNASVRGYIYLDDIFLEKYDNHSKEFLEIMNKNQIKLGIPLKNGHAYYGLYVLKKDLKNELKV